MKSSGYGFVKCQKNNIVLVSEHNAPEDFKCIWTQSILRTIDNNKRVQSVVCKEEIGAKQLDYLRD